MPTSTIGPGPYPEDHGSVRQSWRDLSTCGPLEHWLTERYCLLAEDGRGRLWSNDVHWVGCGRWSSFQVSGLTARIASLRREGAEIEHVYDY